MVTEVAFTISGFVPGFLFSRLWYKDHKYVQKLSRLSGKHKGYHLHHSMWGVVILLTLPFISLQLSIDLFLTSLSIGIIVDHTLKEGFVFITKEANDIWNKIILYVFFSLLTVTEK